MVKKQARHWTEIRIFNHTIVPAKGYNIANSMPDAIQEFHWTKVRRITRIVLGVKNEGASPMELGTVLLV